MSDDDEACTKQEEEWDKRVACILKQMLHHEGISYEWLATQVTLQSETPVTAAELEQQLNDGNISARLLLQIIASLGDKRLSLKDFYHRESTNKRERE